MDRRQACHSQEIETISWGRTSTGDEITGTDIAIRRMNVIHGAPLEQSSVFSVGSNFRKQSVLRVITNGGVRATWECDLLRECQIAGYQGRLSFQAHNVKFVKILSKRLAGICSTRCHSLNSGVCFVENLGKRCRAWPTTYGTLKLRKA